MFVTFNFDTAPREAGAAMMSRGLEGTRTGSAGEQRKREGLQTKDFQRHREAMIVSGNLSTAVAMWPPEQSKHHSDSAAFELMHCFY
jgi:hypothetical protein